MASLPPPTGFPSLDAGWGFSKGKGIWPWAGSYLRAPEAGAGQRRGFGIAQGFVFIVFLSFQQGRGCKLPAFLSLGGAARLGSGSGRVAGRPGGRVAGRPGTEGLTGARGQPPSSELVPPLWLHLQVQAAFAPSLLGEVVATSGP